MANEATKIEFRKAAAPHELRALSNFDRKVFASDYFTPSDWKSYACYWMLVDNRKIGCCAFEEHIPPGTLYLASTGILPAYRGQGYGQIMKAWQIVYAKRHGFTRIVTNARQSNAAIIALNRKFGFRTVRKVPGYYISPDESAVVMNLKLPPQIDRIVRPAP